MKRKLMVTIGLIFVLFSLSFSYADSISLELYVGQTHALQSRVIDEAGFDVNEEVEWTTSDSDIATVKDGLITAKSEGNAVITATVSEGASLRSFSVYLMVKGTVDSIELQIPKSTIYVGEEVQSSFLITPVRNLTVPVYDKVHYSSSDDSVLTVDKDGIIEGISKGEAYVKIISDDGERSSFKKISVNNMVQSIDIQSDITKVYVGEERTVTAVIEPQSAYNKDFEWSSSSHVDIDKNGTFVAQSEGTAYVTATADDGSKKDTIKFEVDSLVKGIEITSPALELTDNRPTYQLEAKLKKKFAEIEPIEDGIEWSTNQTVTASVSKNGLVTAKKTGYVTVTATSKDGRYTDSITLHSVIGEESVVKAKSLSFTSEIKNAHTGEPCLLYYELLPENTTEDKINTEFYGGDGKLELNDGYIKFTPYDAGRYTIIIESENDLRDYTYINVGSNISDIQIDPDQLQKSIETGRYTTYLGQTGHLDYHFVKKYSDSSILLTDVTWSSGDNSIISIDSNGDYTSKALGDTYIQIEALDNNATDLIHIEVVSMSESAEFPAYAEIGLNTSFKPDPLFILEKDILYDYKSILDKSCTIEIEELYVPESFLENEKKFEKQRQSSLKDLIDNNSGDKESIKEEYENSKERSQLISSFLAHSEDGYAPVNYDDQELTDRRFKTLDIASVDDDTFEATVICKAELSILTTDGEHEGTMTIYTNGETTEFLVYDTSGNLLSYNTKLDIDTDSNQSKQATLSHLTREDESLIETLEPQYSALEDYQKPRKDTLIALETARELDMILPSFTDNYQRSITKIEMAEVCFKLYDHYTGEITGVYPYNIFTDTDDPVAIRAYHYGLVPFKEDRMFNPDAQLTREEMVYMLYRTLVALDMPVSSAVSPPKGSTFTDQDSISDDYALAVGQLAYKYTIVDGITDELFEPQGAASIDYTLKYAINLAKSLTEE